MSGVQAGIVREDPEASALLKRWLNNENEGEERKGVREEGKEEGKKEGRETVQAFVLRANFGAAMCISILGVQYCTLTLALNVPLHSVAPNPEIAH